MDSPTTSEILNSDEPEPETMQIAGEIQYPFHPEYAEKEDRSPKFESKPDNTSPENEPTGCQTQNHPELDPLPPPPPPLPPQIGCQITDPLHPECAANKVQSPELQNESTGFESSNPQELMLPPLPPSKIRCQITDPLNSEFVLKPDTTSLENESIGCETQLREECDTNEVQIQSPEFVLTPETTSLNDESSGHNTSEMNLELPVPKMDESRNESMNQTDPERNTALMQISSNQSQQEIGSPVNQKPPQIGCQITDPFQPCAANEIQNPEFVSKQETTSLENESTGCETQTPPEVVHPEWAAHEAQSPEFVFKPETTSLENESTGCESQTEWAAHEIAPNEVHSPEFVLTHENTSPENETNLLHPELAEAEKEIQSPEFVLTPENTLPENETDLLQPECAEHEVQSPEFVYTPEKASLENESTGEIDLKSLPVPPPPPLPSSPPPLLPPPPPPPLSPQFDVTDNLPESSIQQMDEFTNGCMYQVDSNQSPIQQMDEFTNGGMYRADSNRSPIQQMDEFTNGSMDQVDSNQSPIQQMDEFTNGGMYQADSNQSPIQQMESHVNGNMNGGLSLKRSREEDESFDRSPSFSWSGGSVMEISDEEILSDSTQQEMNPSSDEMGQMVCGQCEQLLSYPRGAVHVNCPCCETVNLVLESCQAGTVNCTQCSLLLLYPFGAPSVRCCSCMYVTEIGPHNLRPPLSVQLGENFPKSESESNKIFPNLESKSTENFPNLESESTKSSPNLESESTKSSPNLESEPTNGC